MSRAIAKRGSPRPSKNSERPSKKPLSIRISRQRQPMANSSQASNESDPRALCGVAELSQPRRTIIGLASLDQQRMREPLGAAQTKAFLLLPHRSIPCAGICFRHPTSCLPNSHFRRSVARLVAESTPHFRYWRPDTTMSEAARKFRELAWFSIANKCLNIRRCEALTLRNNAQVYFTLPSKSPRQRHCSFGATH